MKFPKFALFAFHTTPLTFHDTTTVSSVTGADSDLKKLLEDHPGCWVEVALGIYVIKTLDGWHLMHDLTLALQRKGYPVAISYFEESLFGCFPPGAIQKLSDLGVKAHGIVPSKTQPTVRGF